MDRLEAGSKPSDTLDPTTRPQTSSGTRTAAEAAASANKASAPKKAPTPTKRSSPLQAHHRCRLILNIQGRILDAVRTQPAEIVRGINEILQQSDDSKHLIVVSVKPTANDNAVIYLREDQDAASAAPFVSRFKHLVAGVAETRGQPDQKWYKLHLLGVDTGVYSSGTGKVYSPGEVHQALKRNNPVYDRIPEDAFVQGTRWLRLDNELQRQPASSITFAVNDEAIYKQLLAGRVLAAFGKFCKLCPFTDKPPPVLCRNCWSFEHVTHRCQRSTRCDDQPVFLSGDWNLDHEEWNMDDEPADAKTAEIREKLDEKGFILLNEKAVPTYMSHDHRRTLSVLDLTFANPIAAQLDAARVWRVDPAPTYRSDHHAIRWEFNWGETEIEDIAGTKYNFKEVEPADWERAFRTKLAESEDALAGLLDPDRVLSEAELDAAADTFTAALKDATEEVVPKKKPSNKAKPWWSKELSDAASRIASQKEELKDYKLRRGRTSGNLEALIRKSNNYFRRLYSRLKDKWLTETLEDAKVEDIWGFRKWSKGTRNYPAPAI
ncbi:hypothetical protein DFH06DRAFT_996636, partial [Mycena polygramma]